MLLFHFFFNFFFHLLFHFLFDLFLGFLLLLLDFFGRLSLGISWLFFGVFSGSLASLLISDWNWSRSGFLDLIGLCLGYRWCFRVMSRFSMFWFLMACVFLLFLMILLSFFLFLMLDGLGGSFFVSNNALIVDIGGAHSMSCCRSGLRLHVLIGWVLIQNMKGLTFNHIW